MTKPGGTDTGRQEIPQTMNAAAIDEFGPPAVLAIHQLPVPKPAPREVLIALHAAGVGSWDGLVRDGSWRPWGPKAKFPIVPGTDGAGIVVATGARVRKVDFGDPVRACPCSNSNGGLPPVYCA